jgi:hypothetical protein
MSVVMITLTSSFLLNTNYFGIIPVSSNLAPSSDQSSNEEDYSVDASSTFIDASQYLSMRPPSAKEKLLHCKTKEYAVASLIMRDST